MIKSLEKSYGECQKKNSAGYINMIKDMYNGAVPSMKTTGGYTREFLMTIYLQ